jgi:hypothetical protein
MKKLVNIPDKILDKKIDNSAKRIADDFVATKKDKAVVFCELFAQGKRLGLETPEQTKDFLKRYKYVSFGCLSDIQEATEFLKKQKAVEENSSDDLIKWRQAVRERLISGRKVIDALDVDAMQRKRLYYDKRRKLFAKRQKDIDWYNKVSIALVKKIKGMKSFERFDLDQF